MDIEKLLTNRYFCLALLVIIVILVYMLYQNTKCSEGMNNVPLGNFAQNLVDLPYEEGTYNGYRVVGGDFDKMADEEGRKKLKGLGLDDDHDYLKSSDETYKEYSSAMRKYVRKPYYDDDVYDDIPRPLDNHPELSQCQPCNCNGKEQIPSRAPRGKW